MAQDFNTNIGMKYTLVQVYQTKSQIKTGYGWIRKKNYQEIILRRPLTLQT